MSEVKIGGLVFEYDPQTRYLGIGNGEELFGTAEIQEEQWVAFEAAARQLEPGRVRVGPEIGGPDLASRTREAVRSAQNEPEPSQGLDGPHAQARAGEAREKLSGALGMFRLGMERDAVRVLKARAEEGQGRHIELGMATALDRLDRIINGEDYIEQMEALRERSHGAIHFTAPAPEALPLDCGDEQ